MTVRSAEFPAWLHPQGDDVLLDVVVAPRASRTRILAVYDNRLKIQLAAPPVDGKANEELLRFLAETLEVSKAQVAVVGGPANRRKTVRLADIPARRAYLKLAPTKG